MKALRAFFASERFLLAKTFPDKLHYTTAINTPNTSFDPKPVAQELIFSGIQPTGIPHLGNYLGAISNWVSLQNTDTRRKNILYSIVDLHALTLPQDPNILRESKKKMATILIACGIDPRKSVIFEQSKISEHAELAWILNCIAPFGELGRMTHWKSKLHTDKNIKSPQDIESTSGLCLGLFSYPVLQAADILLYKATHVPVGDDQIQHLQLARDIAEKFNKKFNPIFPLPNPILVSGSRIMSLRQPTQKMSKSATSDYSRINLTDPPTTIALKIKKCTTDSIKGVSYDPTERPAISNLVSMYAAVKGNSTTIEDVVAEHKDSNTLQFKEALADVIVAQLVPIQKEIERLESEVGYIEKVLDEGAESARIIAEQNLKEVHRVVGLR
ncbi:12775_t:CDS:2 [Ambispora gerdemannii]|uniref:Tryptophan--tRNA ligase, mitochondrial n=1 Tax=Ambispora gerdemannii TaxID=144530 RepID=A0A9N8Z4T1_9GLOM|nr:12775_t:CDS:2 [Ambispora gerdemannii]